MEKMLKIAIKSGMPASHIDSMARQAGIGASRLAEIKKQANRSALPEAGQPSVIAAIRADEKKRRANPPSTAKKNKRKNEPDL